MDDDDEPGLDWLKIAGLIAAPLISLLLWVLIYWGWNAFGRAIGVL